MISSVRILIADGSPVYTKMFAKAAAETDKKAAAACVSGRDEILDKVRHNDYDVVVLDAEIAKSGLAGLLSEITREMPKAVILVTARPAAANEKLFAEAVRKGASGCMTKPIYGSYDENYAAVKERMAAVIEEWKKLHEERKKQPEAGTRKAGGRKRFYPEIVLVASSTGGPMALERILSGLNGDFPMPILVVQHMLPHFTETLAYDLGRKTKLRVKVAENGESPLAGIVYIAPSGVHMRLDAEKKIYLDNAPPINGVRPAADALFESAAEISPWSGVIAVVLTGMGRDGEKGLAKLKEKQNCVSLAQSEETCVVYGMPRAAVENGLADLIVDLDEIAGRLESFRLSPVKAEKDADNG